MTVTRTKAAKAKIAIPEALDHEAVTLRRELEAAVDAIVPLLGRVDAINERVCDVAEAMGTDETGIASAWGELFDLAGIGELDQTIRRLLVALQASQTVAGGAAGLEVREVK